MLFFLFLIVLENDVRLINFALKELFTKLINVTLTGSSASTPAFLFRHAITFPPTSTCRKRVQLMKGRRLIGPASASFPMHCPPKSAQAPVVQALSTNVSCPVLPRASPFRLLSADFCRFLAPLTQSSVLLQSVVESTYVSRIGAVRCGLVSRIGAVRCGLHPKRSRRNFIPYNNDDLQEASVWQQALQ